MRLRVGQAGACVREGAPCAAAAWALAGLSLLLAAPARAERLPTRRYTIADGLPHDHIRSIVQDRYGFLWLATREGLVRFDGYRFTTYATAEGLPVASINDVLEDGDGEYWIATNGGGVCRFIAAGARCRVYPVGEQLLTNRVNVIHADASGRLWAGTDAGLFRLDPRGSAAGFVRVDLDVLPRLDPVVRSLAGGAADGLWVGTTAGLVQLLPDGRMRHPTFGTAQDAEGVRALLVDREGRVWIGMGGGLVVWKPAAAGAPRPVVVRERAAGAGADAGLPAVSGEAFRFRDVPACGRTAALALLEAASGGVWIGGSDGLARHDGRGFRAQTVPLGPAPPTVGALAEDRDGNLWIGTRGAGAIKVARNGFTTYDEGDGLPSEPISSVLEDRDGRLVVITFDGRLFHFDGGRFTALRLAAPPDLANAAGSYGQIAVQARDGDWWLRSARGLFRVPGSSPGGSRRARYTTRDGLDADEVRRVFEDRSGDVWVGTGALGAGALARWERATGTFRRPELPPREPPWSRPSAFCQDRAGNLWVGFALEGGILRYRDGQVTALEMGEMPAREVTSLHLDHAGRLWFGSNAGLGRIDDPAASRPKVTCYGPAQGLGSDAVTAIAEDRWGRLYLGGPLGVDRLDPETGHVKHYTSADGLAHSEQRVAFCDRENRVWFGTIFGLSRLNPEADAPRRAPAVRIIGLRIAGSDQALSAVGARSLGGLVLAPDRNQIQIEFAGVGFAPGDRLRYQYRLEGTDREWSAPGPERSVNYAGLAPGAYRFRVRALNADGLASPEPAWAAFTVIAPVWRREWFLTAAALAAAAAVHRLYRYRVGRLLELERVRTRIAADLHDDIGATLTHIAILGEVVHKRLGDADAAVAEPLSQIASLSRASVASMGDIVWAIDPHKDHLASLTHRMRRLASEVLPARGIRFQFHAGEEDVALAPGLRRELFLVFKESLHNAVRHSGCESVTIELGIEGAWLVLRVSDDGRGFDPAKVEPGHGLASLRRRTAALGGTLEIAGNPGTRLTLRVPFRRVLGAGRFT